MSGWLLWVLPVFVLGLTARFATRCAARRRQRDFEQVVR